MQKHFNEQYMESEKFPHAGFDGKLRDELINLPDYPQVLKTRVQGDLTIKGVTQKLDEEVTLHTERMAVSSVSAPLRLSYLTITLRVPRMLIKNIAEEVDVRLQFIRTNLFKYII
ncbi:MAG: YceI family protein [Marinilabiliales bacterium]|nr:YceI family protein [Marinilabiliales bacterium]